MDNLSIIEKAPKIKRKRRFSYKDRLAGERALYDSSHAADKSINEHLNRYYAALSGEYTYTSARSGNIVHARTYEKRLELAEIELQRVEDRLAMLCRYGKLGDQKSQEVREYARNLYRIAIKENKYLKNKVVRQSEAANRVSDNIDSLETRLNQKVFQLSTMEAQTNYGATADIHKDLKPTKKETFPDPSSITHTALKNQVNITTVFEKPVAKAATKLENSEPRKTYPSIYNSLKAIDKTTLETFQKLSDDEHTVWPVPAGWKPKKKFSLSRWTSKIYSLSKETMRYAFTGLKIGLAVGAIAYFTSPQQKTSEISTREIPVFYEPTQQVTQVPKVIVPTLETKVETSIVREKAPIKRQYNGSGIGSLSLQQSQSSKLITSLGGSSFSTVPDAKVLDEVKERVRLAKEKIEAERNGSKSINYQPVQKINPTESTIFVNKEKEQEKKYESYLRPITKRESMQKIADRLGKISDERKLREGLFVVKEVTYYPNGEVVIRFPQEEKALLAKAEQ